MKKLILAVLTFTLIMGTTAYAQSLTAKQIIEKADQKQRGESSSGELKMTIVRPTWKREMQMKSWSMGSDYMLLLVTAPARDKGAAFLKRENEIWNWQPTIDRTIKLPPSMMMQSWMGSDFTNDDLVRESSIVIDYTHKLLGEETIEGRKCYKIELTPKEEAPVVWGKIISWIDTEEFMQMKAEMYDEDGYLVNTMYGKNVRKMDDRLLPSIMEVVPADKEGHKTIVEYLNLKFNEPIKESFFSVQNMKRVR